MAAPVPEIMDTLYILFPDGLLLIVQLPWRKRYTFLV
jgi:hypothetical protein